MWNYMYKKAYAGNMASDAIPQGKQPKRDDFDIDSDRSAEIFEYLNKQRNDIYDDSVEYNDNVILTDDGGFPDDDGLYPEDSLGKQANMVSNVKSQLQSTHTPYDQNNVRTPQVAPIKATDFHQQENGWLKYLNKATSLRGWDDFQRAVTFDSPIVRAGMYAVPAYFGVKWAAPYVAAKLDDWFAGGKAYERDRKGRAILDKGDDSFYGGIAAAIAAGSTLLPAVDTNRPGFGLLKNAPKKLPHEQQPPQKQPTVTQPQMQQPIKKSANMLNYNNVISIGDAREQIAGDSSLNPLTRSEIMGVLNAIPSHNPNDKITGKDVLNAAISNGLSAAGDAAIGYLTASALGLQNPLSVGASVGATSLIFRDIF